jgi:CRISPR-associated protein Cas1
MTKRIVEIGSPARLSLRHRQMRIEQEDKETVTIPVEDLGVLILDHPAISHTQGLFAACTEGNVAVLICGERHLPAAVLMPLEGHSLHGKILRQQVAVSEPTCKRLWQAIVRAKIEAQAEALEAAGESGKGLAEMAQRVRSGDPENLEAQAARIYWPRLFGKGFRRLQGGGGANALLNYGYALLRAAVARAVVGAGLHPALGVHHHNQYDAMCLADDLMEPLRPLADFKVHEILQARSGEVELDPETKRELLAILGRDLRIGDRNFPLVTALHGYAASVREVICGGEKEPEIPRLVLEEAPAEVPSGDEP